MRPVHALPLGGLGSTLLLLAALSPVTDPGAVGWGVGAVAGTALGLLLARGMRRHGRDRLGPADRVTLARAVLVCGVTALAVGDLLGDGTTPRGPLVATAVVALLLDGVDGRVARRTGTVSELGARFDLEVDAFLILVLSVLAAPQVGVWVLATGLARYAFVAARVVLPRLRGRAAPRPWCKVVAALQGVVLTVAVAGVLPDPAAASLVALALALLAESFGREAWELWHQERTAPAEPVAVGG